jgi:hypothetical protein
MSIGAVSDPTRSARVSASGVEPTEALPRVAPAGSAAVPDPARAAVPDALQQGVREIMRGIEGEMQRRLEGQEPWDEAGIKRPCPRGGTCSGGPKRGLTPARRIT